MAETEILLESGTNEIEVMQFTINDELYGNGFILHERLFYGCKNYKNTVDPCGRSYSQSGRHYCKRCFSRLYYLMIA